MSTSPLEPGDRPPAPDPNVSVNPVHDLRRMLGNAALEIEIALANLATDDVVCIVWKDVHKAVTAAGESLDHADTITKLIVCLEEVGDEDVIDTTLVDGGDNASDIMPDEVVKGGA